MSVQSQFINEEGVPIKQSIIQQQMKPVQQNENPPNVFQGLSSIPIPEKTRLPQDSNIYKQYSQVIGFYEVNLNERNVQPQYVQSNQVQQPSQQVQQRSVVQQQQISEKSQIRYSNLPQSPTQRITQRLHCCWCNYETDTDIEFKIGMTTLISCLLMSFVFIGPFFLCIDSCKDCHHYCKNCGGEIGVVKVYDC